MDEDTFLERIKIPHNCEWCNKPAKKKWSPKVGAHYEPACDCCLPVKLGDLFWLMKKYKKTGDLELSLRWLIKKIGRSAMTGEPKLLEIIENESSKNEDKK